LTGDEVEYIIGRKRELAVIKIQRFYKRHVLSKKKLLKSQIKKVAALQEEIEVLDPISAEEAKLRIEKRKMEYLKLREKVDEKFGDPMRFYDKPLTEERKKELKDAVSNKRKIHPHSELEKKYKNLDLIDDAYREA
jgi:hypothetical protein